MPVTVDFPLVGVDANGAPAPRGSLRIRVEDVRTVEDDGLGARGLDADGKETYCQSRIRLAGIAEPILVALSQAEVLARLGW